MVHREVSALHFWKGDRFTSAVSFHHHYGLEVTSLDQSANAAILHFRPGLLVQRIHIRIDEMRGLALYPGEIAGAVRDENWGRKFLQVTFQPGNLLVHARRRLFSASEAFPRKKMRNFCGHPASLRHQAAQYSEAEHRENCAMNNVRDSSGFRRAFFTRVPEAKAP